MNPTAPCSFSPLIDAHFDRSLAPPDAHALYEHLPGCTSCRGRYDRHLVLESLLPESPGPKTRLRTTLEIPPPRANTAARRWLLPATTIAVMAACALLFLRRPADDPSFHRRGTATLVAPRLDMYRLRGASPPSVVDVVRKGDELAFAYTNPTGKKRLLVFAVDEHGHVYWYYPAWTHADDVAFAIPIATSGDPVELKEAIVHEFDASRVRIYGIFTDEPLTTRDVEAKLAKASPMASKLEWPDALETSRQVEVQR